MAGSRLRACALSLGVIFLVGSPSLAQEASDSETEAPRPVEGIDYRVYESDGDASSFAEILEAFDRAEAVLVGEEHNDMVGHGFEAELVEGAARRYGADAGEATRPVVLSLEMFERDVQYIVDEYLDDFISEEQFLRSSRPWPDYEVRYRPMVEYVKETGVPLVAANSPRRYNNRVTRLGLNALEALPASAKAFLPPLPYPGPSDAYRAEWDALMSGAMSAPSESDSTEAQTPQHIPSSNAIYSQALWDASMGHAVATALDEHPGALVLHMVGSFHVANGTGTPERVEDYRPGTKQLRIVMVAVDDVQAWDDDEHEGLGDFVILTQKPAGTADGASN